MKERLIQNAIELPSGKIIVSENRHDYKDEEGYTIDGGLTYERGNFTSDEQLSKDNNLMYLPKDKNLILHTFSPLNEIVEKLVWGTFGKAKPEERKRENFKYIRIKDMELLHLKNTLKTQKQLSPIHRMAMDYVLNEKMREQRALELEATVAVDANESERLANSE